MGVILLVLAFFCFLLAAFGQTVLEQPPLDLAYFGLAAWALATLLGEPLVAKRLKRGGE